MKVHFSLYCLLLLTACKNSSKQVIASTKDTVQAEDYKQVDKQAKSFKITPYKLIGDYTVSDTGYLDAVVNGGVYAVVQKDGKLLDTIDKGFGMQKISDNSFLYLTITGTGPIDKNASVEPGYKNAISGSFGKYILIAGNKKQVLAELTQDFDDYFSSPSVINNRIYFWQIKKQGTSELNKISAAEYDPVSNTTKSQYLFDDDIGSDDVGYFPVPIANKDTIYFNAGTNKLMKFSKDFEPYN